MQRKGLFIACFFICTGCMAQKYPFVHYTPKDGLVNSRVREAYQDEKGRMYFMTFGGLSIYDGTVFRNYTVQNGLAADLVNDVLEMGDDSIWIACNSPSLNYLRRGKIGTFKTADGFCPTINKFIRSKEGQVYVIADEGLFIFEQNRFIRLPFTDKTGIDASKFLVGIIEWNDLLLIFSDQVLYRAPSSNFYVFNKRTRTKIAEAENNSIVSACKNNNNEIYVIDSTGSLQLLDTIALMNQKIKYGPVPAPYNQVMPGINYMSFDKYNNFWVFIANKKIIKIDPTGVTKEFSMANGLVSNNFSSLFKDKEGTIWITLHGSGIAKLVSDNIELYDHFQDVSIETLYTDENTDSVYLFAWAGKKIVIVHQEKIRQYNYPVRQIFPGTAIISHGKMYVSDGQNLYLLKQGNERELPRFTSIYKNTMQPGLGNIFVDPYQNIIICGSSYITVLADEKPVYYYPTEYYIDQVAFDKNKRLWIASRAGELYVMNIDPGKPSHYLQLLKHFGKNHPALSARAITVDHFNNVWIGTRNEGLFRFQFDDTLGILATKQFTSREGLSDNFVTHLTCDRENNIWVSTSSGVDKIHYVNNNINIENITRSTNIYEHILKTFVTKNGVAWSYTADGNVIRIGKRNPLPSFTPVFMVTGLKIGNTVSDDLSQPASFSYRQNSFSISTAASSFYDEKQVKYSYLLQGSGNNDWSEPSNNSTFNFINLNPGEYTLKIKASFPGGRYPDQVIDYNFVIHPPWWQTWWFRIGMLGLVIGILGFATRAYYRRKLERQKLQAEKQQAVEKERTRIATDIHDDLGSGLSRIRYLGEMVKLKTSQQQNILPEIEKISVFSDEMVDKMNEIVWALNEKNDSLEAIISYTRSFAVEYLTNNQVSCEVQLPDEIPDIIIKGETRRNIFLSVKECLHNIVKHAEATKATIRVVAGDHLIIHIHDNGRGIDWEKIRPFSNGIMNIKKRMKDAGGTVDFKNEEGTAVILRIPII